METMEPTETDLESNASIAPAPPRRIITEAEISEGGEEIRIRIRPEDLERLWGDRRHPSDPGRYCTFHAYIPHPENLANDKEWMTEAEFQEECEGLCIQLEPRECWVDEIRYRRWEGSMGGDWSKIRAPLWLRFAKTMKRVRLFVEDSFIRRGW